jgi:hypothetical protein
MAYDTILAPGLESGARPETGLKLCARPKTAHDCEVS